MSLKIHSDKAWNIASHWSDVLASDTRTLAAAIDAALVEERRQALEEASKIADDIEKDLYGRSGEATASHISSAIRSLMEKPK